MLEPVGEHAQRERLQITNYTYDTLANLLRGAAERLGDRRIATAHLRTWPATSLRQGCV